MKFLLQSPPEVNLLQQNFLELLCRTRKTDEKKEGLSISNKSSQIFFILLLAVQEWECLPMTCVTQMNNLYLSPCSQRPSLAARERQHLGFDHLKTWTDIPYLVTVYQLHLAQSFFRDTLSHSAALLYSTTTIKDCLFHMQHIFELHSHTLFF